jgi:hypothetical protein
MPVLLMASYLRMEIPAIFLNDLYHFLHLLYHKAINYGWLDKDSNSSIIVKLYFAIRIKKNLVLDIKKPAKNSQVSFRTIVKIFSN